MKNVIDSLEVLEKNIIVHIIQEDAETLFSLMKTENDPIFLIEIIPYFALFIQSCQEYMGEIFLEDYFAKKIKNICNYIKAYGEGFGKSWKRIDNIDIKQDKQFQSQLRFDFMKNWNIHLNLETYWTSEKHIVGNTQMMADFLGIDDIFNDRTVGILYELTKKLGSIVVSIREGISQEITSPNINRTHEKVSINYYYDLNTNKENYLFFDDDNI